MAFNSSVFRAVRYRFVLNARSGGKRIFARINVEVVLRNVLNNSSTDLVIITRVVARIVMGLYERVLFRCRLILRNGCRILHFFFLKALQRMFRGRLRLLSNTVHAKLIRAQLQDVRVRNFANVRAYRFNRYTTKVGIMMLGRDLHDDLVVLLIVMARTRRVRKFLYLVDAFRGNGRFIRRDNDAIMLTFYRMVFYHFMLMFMVYTFRRFIMFSAQKRRRYYGRDC